jgi:hypothetical protein
MEPPSLATELRNLLLWLTLACFSFKFVRKRIDWTGRAGSFSQNDRNGRGCAQRWAWHLKILRALRAQRYTEPPFYKS